MPNVRATANPADPKATVEVGGVELDQYFSVNLDTSKGAVKDAIAANLVTVVDSAPYDEDESQAQQAAIAEYRDRLAATAGGEAEAETADQETHATAQRRQPSRSA